MTTTFHSTRSTTDSLTAKQAIRGGTPMTAACSFRTRVGKTKVDAAPCRASRTSKSPPRCWARWLPDSRPRSCQCDADAYGEQWSDERITPLSPPRATITP